MGGNLIVKNASELVTCSGHAAKCGRSMGELHIIADGAVIIENGLIRKVGRTADLSRFLDAPGFSVIDAAGRAVLPGFVDAHTHFVFGGYRADEFAWRLRGDSYMAILRRGGGILSTVAATRKASMESLVREGIRRLDAMAAFGVTTVEGKSGYGLDHPTEIKQLAAMAQIDDAHPVDVVRTFMGAHAVPLEFSGRPDAYLDFVVDRVLPEVAHGKLAHFCDVFCEKGVFTVPQSRRLLRAAGNLGLEPKLHADEMVWLGGAELAAELKAVSADHLLHASDDGIRDLARSGVVATLLPATAFTLREPYARARQMIDAGCAVALATDFNPGSCCSESIPLLFALATLYMGMSTEEAVTALTLNGAAAVGRADTIGSIDPGKLGDLVILEYPSYRFIPYRVGVNTVRTVVKKGRVIHEADIL